MSNKLSACMSVVKSMDDQDADALMDRLEKYQKSGIPVERAQMMAASDTLAELEAERREIMQLLREQHPEIFVVTNSMKGAEQDAPDADDGSIKKSDDRKRTPYANWLHSSLVGEKSSTSTPIETLGLSQRASKALAAADINDVETLLRTTPRLRKGIPGVGKQALFEIEDAISRYTSSSGIKKSQARDVTETPEFKRWFGNSKVVDADGNPLVVYHGTGADIAVFRSSRKGWYGKGMYFTDDASLADEYSLNSDDGQNIIPVYLSIERPYFYTESSYYPGEEANFDLIREVLPHEKAQRMIAKMRREDTGYIGRQLQDALREMGHDGLIVESSSNPGAREFIVFDPEQIKSAIGNNGQFNPANPDIRKSTERNAMGFYSALAKGIEGMQTKSAPAGAWKTQIKGLVNKGAVKQDEVTWSGLEDWLDLQEGKITKEQIAAYLEQGGVKVEETTLSNAEPGKDLDDWLYSWSEENTGKTARSIQDGDTWEETLSYAKDEGHQDVIDRIQKKIKSSPPKYSQYTLPGGENYREVLLTLPSKEPATVTRYQVINDDGDLVSTVKTQEAADRLVNGRSGFTVREVQVAGSDNPTSGQYRSSHWDQPNVLAHIRVNDRTDADGNKVLFVEELQSDWGQDGKKKGFAKKGSGPSLPEGWTARKNDAGTWRVLDQNGDLQAWGDTEEQALSNALGARVELQSDGIPSAPFVTKTEGWLNLALKRIVTMAVEGGYDKVAFINGQQSADRYDLSKQISRVVYNPTTETLNAFDDSGSSVLMRGGVSPEQVEDYIGKDPAKRLFDPQNTKTERRGGKDVAYHEIAGEDLKVGGEGMKTFYDTIVQTAVKKLISKMDGKLETVGIADMHAEREVVAAQVPGENMWGVYDRQKGQWLESWDNETYTSNPEDAELTSEKTAKNIASAIMRDAGVMLEQPGFSVTPKMVEQVSSQGMPLFSRARNPQESTQEFIDWSEGAPVIHLGEKHEFKSGQPVVVEALHGTTNSDLTEFKRERANIESDWGAGFYASNTPDDVAANYANKAGPDLLSKRARLSERIADEMRESDEWSDASDDEIDAEVEARVNEVYPDSSPNTLKLYVRMSNPAVQGGKGETFFDYTEEYDEETDSYAEPTGLLVDFVESLRGVASDFSEADADGAMGSVWEKVNDDGGIGLSDLVKILKSSEGLAYVTDDDGNIASTEVIRLALEDMGFDGVIDTTVSTKFKSMKGMNKDTVHFIAFDPTQLKSATGNSGAFSRTDRDITKTAARNPQVDTKEFRDWFGDSKVVDKNGKPLVVYHGTDAMPFYEFRVDKELGAHFGTRTQALMRGGSLIKAYLSLKNPVRLIDNGGDFDLRSLSEMLPMLGIASYDDVMKSYKSGGINGIKAMLESLGYDGAVYLNRREIPGVFRRFDEDELNAMTDAQVISEFGKKARDSYIAFRPEQIKSATGNQGTFDPKNPDIRKSSERTVGDYGREYTPEQRAMFKNIGRTVAKPTLIERLKNSRQDLGKRMTQGIVDQFAPLKELGNGAYTLARLSKGAAGAFEALLGHGKLKIVDGAYDADMTGGFIDRVGKPLGKELEDFMNWVAANRAENLMAEDREHLFTQADIDAGKSLADGDLKFDYLLQNGATTRDRKLAYEDSLKKFNEFNKNVMDIAEQSGLIDPESRKLWENEFYVPFYRVSEEEGEFVGAKIKGGLVRKKAFEKLKGGSGKLNADLTANVMQNWAHLIDASAKNRAAKATLEASTAAGIATEADEETVRQLGKVIGKEGGTVWFMDEGKKRHFVVGDPYILDAINSLEYAGLRGPLMDALSTMKHVLTIGVTASPAFKVRNLIRDSIQAMSISELSYNPIENFRAGVKASARDSQEYVSALASGGLIRFGSMLEGNSAERVRKLINSGVDPSTILDTQDKVKAVFSKAWGAYEEIGNRGEEINRAALYTQLRKKGMSHSEAALAARDLMDFSLQGTFGTIRFLTQVVPFLNARLQGLYKLGRGAAEDPKRFSTVLGATALASIALLAAYGDDEDWKRREDWDRDGFWWFKFGGTAFRIPKPFEIGAIATLAERGVELFTNDQFTAKMFGSRVLSIMGDNLSMNPIPQAVKPILDVYSNKDSFSGRPIESMGMERLKSEYRYTADTSMIARASSSAMNAATGLIGKEALSPVQIDSMLRGYFGWLGTFVVAGADMAIRPLTDEPTRPQADYLKVVTQGFLKSLPDSQSKYVSAMYEQAQELERAYATHRQMIKEGKVQEASEFAEEHKDQLARYRQVEAVKKVQSTINEQVRRIERSDMDPAKKREEIQKLRMQASNSAERIYGR